jgi:DNA-binding CsgD family transcriptional regulator
MHAEPSRGGAVCGGVHTTEHALVELAHHARRPSSLREGALSILTRDLGAEIGVLVVRDGAREVRSFSGLDASVVRAMDAGWARLRKELAPIKERALRDGATTDRRVLGERLTHTSLYRSAMKPLGGTETLVLVPQEASSPIGLVALGRLGGRFSDAALAHARSLLPAVSLALRVASRPVDPLPTLSDTERELLSHLALGFSTAEIARARSRSFFTVRNQLAALYRKLEVANRAEALGRLCRA